MAIQLNEKAISQLLHYISGGVPLTVASEAVGISGYVIVEWIAKGRSDRDQEIDSPERELSMSISTVDAEKIFSHCQALEEQSKNWQARAWLLERRYRKHFGFDAAQLEEIDRLYVEIKKLKDELGKT